MSIGNTQLVEYGIFDEKAEFRAHLGVKTKAVYLFRTDDMQALIQSTKYQSRSVWSEVHGMKIETARGYLVPVVDIPRLVWAAVSEAKLAYYGFLRHLKSPYMSTSDRGDAASQIVNELLENGELKLPVNGKLVTDAMEQIAGHDLIVTDSGHTIQVKCDLAGGYRERGGTGNLFIQYAECNPLKSI